MSDQLVAEAAVYTTHSEHETNIHAPGGIRTGDPSNRAADLRLRPHGHRREPSVYIIVNIFKFKYVRVRTRRHLCNIC